MAHSFVPGGSYTETSKDVQSHLFCSAQRRDHSWIPATLNLTELETTSISNEDGFLVNNGDGTTPVGYVPHGSYLETCKEISVILSASCKKGDGTWQISTLDITGLREGATISNIDGVLTADS